MPCGKCIQYFSAGKFVRKHYRELGLKMAALKTSLSGLRKGFHQNCSKAPTPNP